MRVIYCHTFVSPGMGATVHTFFFFRVLMILDFPTFGYPIKPTDICFLSEWRTENCRSSWIKAPFPKELLIDACIAIVGADRERCLTHRAYDQLPYRKYGCARKVEMSGHQPRDQGWQCAIKHQDPNSIRPTTVIPLTPRRLPKRQTTL